MPTQRSSLSTFPLARTAPLSPGGSLSPKGSLALALSNASFVWPAG